MWRMRAGAKSLESCLRLCDPMVYSQSDSSVCGTLQARILDGLPCPPPGDLPDPGIKSTSLAVLTLPGGFWTTVPPERPNPLLQSRFAVAFWKHRAPSSSAGSLWHQNRWSLCLQKPSDAPPLEPLTNISSPPPNRKTHVVDAVIVGVRRELGACLEPGGPAGVDRRARRGSCGALMCDGWPVAAMHHPGPAALAARRSRTSSERCPAGAAAWKSTAP